MWRAILVLLVLSAALPCRASIPLLASQASTQLCRPAMGVAERAYNIPTHLLAAIGRIESGRKDVSAR